MRGNLGFRHLRGLDMFGEHSQVALCRYLVRMRTKILAPLLVSWEAWDNLLKLSEPQCPGL